MMNYIRVTMCSVSIAIGGMIRTIVVDSPLEPAVVISLVASIVASIVAISGAFLMWRNLPNQDRRDDNEASKTSQEIADLATAARLRLEIKVIELEKDKDALRKVVDLLRTQLLEKNSLYHVSFALRVGNVDAHMEELKVIKVENTAPEVPLT